MIEKRQIKTLRVLRPLADLVLIICLIGMILAPTASRADIVYTFIKVTCDYESKIAVLQGYYLENEEGAQAAKAHNQNIYYLSDITENRFQGKSKEINVCNFGSGQSASFIAQESREHPRANGVMLFLNNKQIHNWYTLAYGGWTLEIHALGEGRFDLHWCRKEHLPEEPECQSSHIVDGKTYKDNALRGK